MRLFSRSAAPFSRSAARRSKACLRRQVAGSGAVQRAGWGSKTCSAGYRGGPRLYPVVTLPVPHLQGREASAPITVLTPPPAPAASGPRRIQGPAGPWRPRRLLGRLAVNQKSRCSTGLIADHLLSISPNPGDAVFIPGGTVHTLGDDVVVFEVQQNSDTTFRLYDWGHIDPETKKPRALQVDEALACIEFGGSNGGLISPRVETTSPAERERLFDCHAFRLWRLLGQDRFTVGAKGEPARVGWD